jgi:hypothetical protein
MAADGIELKQPVKGDAVPLLDCKRMVGGFQHHTRSLSAALWMNLTFEVQRIGVSIKPIGEPAEPWAEFVLLATIESLDVAHKVLARQGRPHAEAEWLVAAASDRQLEHRTHKEMLPFQNAEILGQKVAAEVKRAVGRLVLSTGPLRRITASQVNQALMRFAADSTSPRIIP